MINIGIFTFYKQVRNIYSRQKNSELDAYLIGHASKGHPKIKLWLPYI
ncbi:MAG: hypothetical protein AAF757_13580 [Cyanobacteria bacterium P01_D01_bin.116]